MIKKIKRSIFGNDKPPVQVPVDDEEYILVGEEPSAYEIREDGEVPLTTSKFGKKSNEQDDDNEKTDNKKSKEKNKDESKPQLKIITKKIMPKLLTIRLKSPDDFDNIKNIVEHDLIIITIDVPPEAIVKEFLDFKGYLETMNYSLGKIEENVILAYKKDITIDRYPLKSEQ
jgi:hypothetical protein